MWSIEKNQEVATKMSALSTYRSTTIPQNKHKRLWMKVVLVLAMALASIAVVAVQAQAGSFDHRPPNEVLFKGTQALQTGNVKVFEWHYYYNGSWKAKLPYYNDTYNPWPRAAVVPAGSTLRIKIDKPQRPRDIKIYAYRRLVAEGGEGIPGGRPQILKHSLGRVVQDGKTVGWNVYFDVNEPARQYYLSVYVSWDRVPGTHISYGWASKYFHVRTS